MNKKLVFLSLLAGLLIGGCTTTPSPLPGANEGSWQGEKIRTYPGEKILEGEISFTVKGDTVYDFKIKISFYSALFYGATATRSSCEISFPPMKINPEDYSFSNPQITDTPPWTISNHYDLRPHINSLFGKFDSPQKASGLFVIANCSNKSKTTIYKYVIGERDAWTAELKPNPEEET
jgi:hypothetical protein